MFSVEKSKIKKKSPTTAHSKRRYYHLSYIKRSGIVTTSPFKLIVLRSVFLYRCKSVFFFKKWANPGLFFVYFWSFQTNNTIFTTNQCEKMSCPSSIRRQDSNPGPLERESPPITTRPGLSP